jgi:hypothetical protein
MTRVSIFFFLFLVFCFHLSSDVPDPQEDYEPILIPPYEDYYRYRTATGTGFRFKNTTKIWVGGDVMFNWGVRDAMKGEDPVLPFRSFTSLLYNMDYRMLNLETPILHTTPTLDKLKSYVFYGEKKDLRVLTALQIDGVFLGNNHTMDLGESGLKDTLLSLEETKISYAGAGKTEEESLRPLIFKKIIMSIVPFPFLILGRLACFPDQNHLALLIFGWEPQKD